ncbi:MAG: NusG domain II-containing protein [Defluviitaleaceae bacterium]|nr:NusG domain II-containing protein [Defluviitaleaceae bacterium]MCL2274759.1 NusG domain II-containing protein [Defluviitaleaceae bacterium]
MKRTFISRKELLIILGVLAIAVLLHLFFLSRTQNGMYAVITVQNTAEIRLPLSEDIYFPLPHNPQVIFRIKNGEVSFAASNCSDQICVRAGGLAHRGQHAACLPNRVLLTIAD